MLSDVKSIRQTATGAGLRVLTAWQADILLEIARPQIKSAQRFLELRDAGESDNPFVQAARNLVDAAAALHGEEVPSRARDSH